MTLLTTQIPQGETPAVNPKTGQLHPAWRYFLLGVNSGVGAIPGALSTISDLDELAAFSLDPPETCEPTDESLYADAADGEWQHPVSDATLLALSSDVQDAPSAFFSGTTGTSSYRQLPDGTVIQVMSFNVTIAAAGTGATQNVTWPTAFPNAFESAVISQRDTGVWTAPILSGGNTTGISVGVWTLNGTAGTSVQFNIIAIGR